MEPPPYFPPREPEAAYRGYVNGDHHPSYGQYPSHYGEQPWAISILDHTPEFMCYDVS